MKRLTMNTVGNPILLFSILLLFTTRARPAFGGADPRAEAREHFRKGVEAFEGKRFGEAAEEFQAAYKLSPAFVVLYNIGQVNVALGRSVEAVDAFETYLKQGASAISPARAREVESEIDKQLARIGTVKIGASPVGTEIRLDGRLVGHAPLPHPLRVTAGSHTIEANLLGYAGQARDVDVAGRSESNISFELASLASEHPEASPPPAPTSAVVPREPAPAPSLTASASSPPIIEHVADVREAPREPHASTFWGWQHTAGLVLTLGGVATVAVGGIYAYLGANHANDARNQLSMATASTPDNVWNQELSDFNSGKQQNEHGWIIAGIGAAVVVGGGLLFLTAPASHRSVELSFAPWISSDSSGAVMAARW